MPLIEEYIRRIESAENECEVKKNTTTSFTICSTKECLEYYSTLGQQNFDTELNKMVVCVELENKKLFDFFGNII